MASTSICIRIDDELKKKAEKVFEASNLSTTAAITMFLQEACKEQGLPFSEEANPLKTIDPELISEAKAVCDELGIPFQTALNMFLKALVREKGIPFRVTTKVSEETESSTDAK